MLKSYSENQFNLVPVILIILVFVVGSLAGYFYAQTVSPKLAVVDANTLQFSQLDQNYLSSLVGSAAIQFSDKYCEKRGLKSDLLPQTLTVPDQNGTSRQVQYFVPVCVP